MEEQIVFKGIDGSAQVQSIMKQVDVLQGELHSLISQKNESESNLDKVKQELSGSIVQIESLKEELESKTVNLKKVTEDNEGLEKKVKDLELAMASQGWELSEMEERLTSARNEVVHLKEEKERLGIRASQFEKKHEHSENSSSTQITSLEAEVQKLQLKLYSLQTERGQHELQIEREKQELSDGLAQMKQQNAELITKFTVHQSLTKGQEEMISNLQEELESLKNEKRRVELQNHKEQEKLSESLTEMGKQNNELKDKIAENQAALESQKDTIKGLQQDLDLSKTEKRQFKLQIEKENAELRTKITELQCTLKSKDETISTLTTVHKQIKGEYQDSKMNLQVAERKIEDTADEFYKKFEDSLRILSRRIRVAEQLHLENKDVCQNTKAKYEKENNYLKEKIATTEVSVKKMKEITLSANDMLTSLDVLALKFEECSGNFLNRISKASCEVLFVKDWVKRKNSTVKHDQEDITCLATQLDEKEIEILALREKVWKLEHKVRELEKTVIDKEDCLLGMEEEKREAIRQLCVWIDYHRSRSDYLKKMLTERSAVRSSQRAT